jgi:hypothetical protein
MRRRGRALRRRYGHAGKRRSAAAYDFLRWMPGWTITKEDGPNLIAHKMAGRQGDPDGPAISFARLGPRKWLALFRRAGHGTTPRAAAEDAGAPT